MLGYKLEELTLSERIYLCECGNRLDRDINAAVNNLKDSEDEELHLIMVDNHIPAGAKLY